MKKKLIIATLMELIRRHPLAMTFVTAAYAFIGWNMRHDLVALAMVVGAPVALVAVVIGLTFVKGVKARPLTDESSGSCFEPSDIRSFFNNDISYYD